MADRQSMSIVEDRIGETHGRMWRLALVRAFWPLVVLVTVYLVLALTGLIDAVSRGFGAVLAILFFASALVLLWRGYQRLKAPTRAEAITALDGTSELRPMASLTDRPAKPTMEAHTLWSRHREILFRELKKLRVPFFEDEWRAADRYRLRFAIPALLVGAALLAGVNAPGRLMRAFDPDIGALMGADKMVVEAWVTPPEHTGRAPIFLKTGAKDVRVPEGSEITLRTKAPSAPKLILKGKKKTRKMKFEATPDGAFEIKARLDEPTRVSARWWGERAAWKLDVSPDDPPTVEFVSMPFVGPRDTTEFTWAARDDYGVVKLEIGIKLREPHPAAPDAEDRVALSLPGAANGEITDKAQIDLTRHRWAGLAVDLRLIATDGAGQEGVSPSTPFVLPDKFFLDPLARAAQDIRVTVLREPREYKKAGLNLEALRAGRLNTSAANRLALAPAGVQKGALMLDAITWQGERYFDHLPTYLSFRTAHGILESASSKAEADEVDTLLWALALKIEYGTAADALRRLEAAKAALEQALRNGASEEEIRRRMDAFRDAANEYLAAKMAEAMANGLDAPPPDQDGEAMAGGSELGGQDFEDMLDALEDLTETGASDQARQLLSDITNMLQNLDFQQGQNGSGQGMPGQPGEQAENDSEAPPEEQELTDAMKRLNEILREQRQLNDDTLAEERGERQPGGAGQQPQGNQRGEPGGEEGEGEEEGQGAGQRADREGGRGGGAEENDPEGEGEGEGTGRRFAEGSLEERQARLGEMVERLTRERGGKSGQGEDALEGALDEDALGEAREAQQRAEELLGMGNQGRAARNQERATQLLSEINRDLAQALDEMREARENESGARGETDPFGRLIGGGGNDSESVEIPAEAERQRAKDILDELRRRYNEAETEEERDYLRRLMDRF